MKSKIAALLCLGLLISEATSAADLNWMVGCWETPDQSAREVWVKDQDGTLIGFSVTLDGDRIVFHEVLRIIVKDDGSATYTAHPDGQATTTFTAAAVSATAVTFSNPSHDYPKEVSYRREGSLLFATISALEGKNPNSFNKRACE